jgi:hypothetical protein
LTDDKPHYYLLGVGPDQKPLTNDDLLPDIADRDRPKTGLLIKPSSLHAKLMDRFFFIQPPTNQLPPSSEFPLK